LRLIVLGWYGGANLTWLTRMDVVGYRPRASRPAHGGVINALGSAMPIIEFIAVAMTSMAAQCPFLGS